MAATALVLVLVGLGAQWLGGTPASRSGVSLVVLPFSYLGGDPAQDYIADVLTDELTTYLSRLPGTFVIARNTAFTFKGKPVDVRQLGKDLNVRYVLEGSVEPSGNRIRTNAQLIDADSGAHLWADQFDADRTDLLATQDEIVTRLARALQIQFAADEVLRVGRVRSGDSPADDLALRCYDIFLRNSNLRREIEAAYPLCEKALLLDPSNLRALSVLARLYAGRAASLQSADPHGDLTKAEDLASRALAIDPNQSLARQARALVLQANGNTAEAVVEAQRALALNPSDIGGWATLCLVLNADGQPAKALEFAEKAMQLSPRDPFLWAFYAQSARANMELQHYDRAIEWLRRSMAENPDFPTTLAILAAALALDGRDTEAHAMLARYFAHPLVVARTIKQLAGQVHLFDAATYPRYLDGLRKAGMPEE
jgi:adenylate cyclase